MALFSAGQCENCVCGGSNRFPATVLMCFCIIGATMCLGCLLHTSFCVLFVAFGGLFSSLMCGLCFIALM